MAKLRSEFLVKIGGNKVPQQFLDAVEEIVVDSSLQMPDMCTISVRDPKLSWADDEKLDIGKQVEIKVETGEDWGGHQGVLFTGEITALEPHFSGRGGTLMLVRGYDKSHRLHRGRKTRTFLGRKDSELAREIAQEVGLEAEVDHTSVVYDYVLQNNQTNMEFLLARAEHIGYQVFVADGKLYFKQGDFCLSETQPAELVLGDNLRQFMPSWRASHQVDQVSVVGWDPKAKGAITSQRTPNEGLNQGGMTQTGGATAKAAFNASAHEIVTDRPVSTPGEAEEVATGLGNDVNRGYVQAEGVCDGDPALKAGCKIRVANVGRRFSGEYFVTSAAHIYNESGYETRFSINGRQPHTLSFLVGAGDRRGQGKIQGVVTGLVTNLNDPENLGRVKVKYPWLGTTPDGAEIESFWVRIASPMAGNGRGFLYLPETNDEVLIAFEHGDIHRPYIVGVLWNSRDLPPKPNNEVTSDGKVRQRVIRSRQGHLIILDDSDRAEQIYVKSKSGHTLVLDDSSGGEKITIRDKSGNEMQIDSVRNSMSINVKGDFKVEAKGMISLNSQGNMSLESKAAANLTATRLSAQARGACEVKGNVLTLDGGPTTTITGGIVKIN